MSIIENFGIIKIDKRKKSRKAFTRKRPVSPNVSPIILLPKSDGYAKTKAENKIKRGIAEHSCTIFSGRPPTDIISPSTSGFNPIQLSKTPTLFAVYSFIGSKNPGASKMTATNTLHKAAKSMPNL